eukprot:GGOE01056912.1.p1 GENE.GGOE01056912.1~~GGOE01056912.1.p1  ORF type:complete len:350 (+),score=46.65 GGOE01056912.1:41-1090(+)
MPSVIECPYSILGVPFGASTDDIKAAFRRRALRCHPDKNPNGELEFKKVNWAYSLLTNVKEKEEYDLTHASSAHFRPEDVPHHQRTSKSTWNPDKVHDFLSAVLQDDRKVSQCKQAKSFNEWYQQQQREVAERQQAQEEVRRRWKQQQELEEMERYMQSQRLKDIELDIRMRKEEEEEARAAEATRQERARLLYEQQRADLLQEMQAENRACDARLSRLADKWAEHAADRALHEVRSLRQAHCEQKVSRVANDSSNSSGDIDEEALDRLVLEVRQRREALQMQRRSNQAEVERLWQDVKELRNSRMQSFSQLVKQDVAKRALPCQGSADRTPTGASTPDLIRAATHEIF